MLDIRLQMIYDLIPDTDVMCDIGTDHGKLPVCCIKTGKTRKALACDLRKGPLSACKSLVEKEGLENKITTILSDGFLNIPQHEFEKVDCFVLAGMGGELIQKIITDRHCDSFMVLQPQSAVNELVTYLLSNGYCIYTRRFCEDYDKLYTAMLVKYDGITRNPDIFCNCEKNAAFKKYLENELKKCEISLRGLNLAKTPDTARIQQTENLKSVVMGELEKC